MIVSRPRYLLSMVILGLLAGSALAQPTSDFERYYVIFHQKGASHAAVVQQAGGIVVHDFPEYAAVAGWLPSRAVEALRANPTVAAVEVDPKRQLMGQTVPYGIPMVQANDPAFGTANASSCTVCVIDSGFYRDHEDLTGNLVNGTNDSGTGNWWEDSCGHGTHVGGTVAALNNTLGVLGTIGNASLNLHIVKVFNGSDCKWAYSSDLVAALRTCRNAVSGTTQKLVVSMSLGGDFSSSTEDQAFQDAYNAGVLSIAAAGNGGNTRTSYPAGYASVVSVAAVDSTGTVASFSQQNADVELAAPGVGVLSTVPWKGASLTVGTNKYLANHIENAARTDGITGALADGGLCGATNSAWSGKVVLCERGTYSFFDKTMAVQNSGGLAAVIYNNASGNFSGTLGTGNSSTIPAISLSQEDGKYLVANSLGQNGTVVDSAAVGSGYEAWNGTSMATPHVSGVAALVWSYYTTKTNADIRTALQASAEDKGAAGRDNAYGYGIVKAKAASDYLASSGGGTSDTTAPVISNVQSTKGRGGKFDITWTTNELSNSEVTFTKGASGTYTNSTMVTSHKMSFRGMKGVLYEYYVSSTDAAGNKATAGPFQHQN